MANQNNQNLFLLINSFGGGGAERQFSILADYLPFSRIYCLERDNVYLDDSKYDIIYLSKHTAKTSALLKYLFTPIYALRLYSHLRKTNTPHIISVLERSHIVCLILSFLLKIKYCVSIQLSHKSHYKGVLGNMMKLIFKLVIRRSNLVIPNSKAGADEIIEQYETGNEKVVPIYNGYDFHEIKSRSSQVDDFAFPPLIELEYILCVARFFEQKAQDRLIHVFSSLKKTNQNLKLVFAGIGNEYERCIDISKSLGLSTFVINKSDFNTSYDVYFLGFQGNPLLLMKYAKIFAFPTFYEGLPNALIESMICGTVPISSDCPTGPREIIAPETNLTQVAQRFELSKYGILVEPFSKQKTNDIDTNWEDGILKLLSDQDLYNSIKENNKKRVEEFNMKNIVLEWHSILEKKFRFEP